MEGFSVPLLLTITINAAGAISDDALAWLIALAIVFVPLSIPIILAMRFTVLSPTSYFLHCLRYETPYILLCQIEKGLDDKYEPSFYSDCVIAANPAYLRIHTIGMPWKKTIIPYDRITDCLILLDKDTPSASTIPKKIKYIKRITIKFVNANGQKDFAELSLKKGGGRFVFPIGTPFNRYVIAKANLFECLSHRLDKNQMHLEVYDPQKHGFDFS